MHPISDEELAKELREAWCVELGVAYQTWDNLSACIKKAYKAQARRAKELLTAPEPPKDLLRAAREAFCENARLTSNWDADDGPISRRHLDSDIAAVLRVAREYYEKRPLDEQIRWKREEIAYVKVNIEDLHKGCGVEGCRCEDPYKRILAVLESQLVDLLKG